jgi:hypothetical protein
MADIQSGTLMIADISGYTAFLTQSELEHARDILDHLLNTLLGSLQPPLAVGNLEGDAIFVYAPQGSFLQGQTLVETVEKIYFAFCAARDTIHRSCKCNACALVSTLDLKFVVHYGQYALQTLGTRTELQGSDVIVAHRLLKKHLRGDRLLGLCLLQSGCRRYTPPGRANQRHGPPFGRVRARRPDHGLCP